MSVSITVNRQFTQLYRQTEEDLELVSSFQDMFKNGKPNIVLKTVK